jgi:hypothetical protein
MTERLIAAGTYRYFLDQQPVEMVETWQRLRLDDGAILTLCERDAPAFGSGIRVECLAYGDQITEFSVDLGVNTPQGSEMSFAQYRIDETHFTVERSTPAGDFQDTDTRPDGLIVAPLMRIFIGGVIRQIMQVGEGVAIPVLVPWLHNPADHQQVLMATIEQRYAVFLGDETIPVGAGTFDTRVYQYIGGNYDQDSRFWVGEDDVLIYYSTPQANGLWTCELTDYKLF